MFILMKLYREKKSEESFFDLRNGVQRKSAFFKEKIAIAKICVFDTSHAGSNSAQVA